MNFINQQPNKACLLYLVQEALDICVKWPEEKNHHKNAVYIWAFFLLDKKKISVFEPKRRFPFARSLFQLQSALPSEVQKDMLFAWASFLPDFESADQWQWIAQLKDAFSLHGESMDQMGRYISRLVKFAVEIGNNDKGRILKLVHDLLAICESWKDDARKAEAISAIWWQLGADSLQDNSHGEAAVKSPESFLDEQDRFPLARRILSLQPATSSSDEPEIWSTIRAFATRHADSGEAS